MKPNILIEILFFLFITVFAANTAFGNDNGDMAIHGFVSQGYLRSSDNNYFGQTKDGSFQFNEIGISFSALLSNELGFCAQLFSKDLGTYGNNELMVDFASIDYTYKDWLGFRAGKIKTPHGLYNRQRDADMLRTSILMPQSVYNEGVRNLVLNFYGISFYGNVNLHPFGILDYEFYGGTIDVPAGTMIAKSYFVLMEYSNFALYNAIVNIMGVNLDSIEVVFDHIEGGMLTWNTPVTGLRFRATNLIGKGELGLGSQTAEISLDQFSAFSAEYELANLTFAAEYMKGLLDVDMPEVAETPNMEGYYFSINWEVIKWLTVQAAYGEYYPDAKDKDGKNLENLANPIPDYWAWQKDITLSARFNLNEYFCIKLETHVYDGLGHANLNDNKPLENAEQNWVLYAVKSSLNF